MSRAEGRDPSRPAATNGHSDRMAVAQDDPRVIMALEEYLAALEAGQAPDRQAFLERHAAVSEALAECLDGLEFVQAVGPQFLPTVLPASPVGAWPAECLGDYRILREVGRGGMGIVYEAEQKSLSRRVALKVLPLAAAMDARLLQRFRTEAQAAAQLHHSNIVPVFSVGCEGGVHYYAMQYIEGQTLAGVIRKLRQSRGADRAIVPGTDDMAFRLAYDPAIGLPEAAGHDPYGERTTVPLGLPAAATPPRTAPLSDAPASTRPAPAAATAVSPGGRVFYRTVARMGIQAAEALDHAHERGVLHRDIKPSNLLLDIRGKLWITDFGVARLRGDVSLTMTGDVLGTLRYMSPEQALAKRGLVDHRSDIYSLGVTLYELLTLAPVFAGRDHQELVRQIVQDDPIPPRLRSPSIPRELETIVLKALAKEPEGRYATAQEMGDDLVRFLEDRPIRARRPTLLERAAKWSRRHKPAVATAAALLILAVVGLAISNVLIGREQKRTERQRDLVAAKSREAIEKAESLERQLYIHRVNLAQREVAESVVAAERLLDRCPPALRGWEWSYLRRSCHLDLLTFSGHTRSVSAVAFSPDGRRIATGSGARFSSADAADPAELVLWDASTGDVIRRFAGLKGGVWSVAFSPDGRRIAAGGGYYRPDNAGHLTVWDVATGRILLRKDEPNTNVLCVAFSPDGGHVAAGYGHYSSTYPGLFKLWDATSGEEEIRLSGPSGGVNSLAFSPDGHRMALAGSGVVELWDLETRRKLRDLRGHTGWVYAVAFRPDGKRLCTTGADNTIRLWDPATGEPILAFRGHDDYVFGLTFSPDGRRIASASEDNSVKLWDADDGRELFTLHGHTDGALAVAFSPDGTRLVSASADRTLKLWDATSNRQVVLRGHTGWVHGLAFRPDGARLATASGDGTVKLWDPRTGEPIRTLRGHVGWAFTVAFHPDGRRLASAGEDNAVRIWDATSGEPLATLRGHTHFVKGLAFSPDGRLLASASEDHTVRVWDAATYREVFTLRGHTGRVVGLAFSPDGRRIASAAWNRDFLAERPGELKVWDAATGREVLTVRGHTSHVVSVAFSHDGLRLASASEDKSVRIWNAMTGEPIHMLLGHNEGVTGAAFSPDDRRLVSTAYDGSLKLWDASTGDELLSLRGHGAGVVAVAFSPDGLKIASASVDNTAKIWDATPPGPRNPGTMVGEDRPAGSRP